MLVWVTLSDPRPEGGAPATALRHVSAEIRLIYRFDVQLGRLRCYHGNPTHGLFTSHLMLTNLQLSSLRESKIPKHLPREWSPAPETDTDHLPGSQHKPEPVAAAPVKVPRPWRNTERRRCGMGAGTINTALPSDGSFFS